VLGIIGLLFIIWFGAYVVQDIPTNPWMIPLLVLWSLMLIGGCIDVVLVGREGKGGLVILAAGTASYLLVFLLLVMGKVREWFVPALIGSGPLLISGFLFYICGQRRKKAG
jgi:hypothetical protein